MTILSFDIDLNRIHAWSSISGRIAYNQPELTPGLLEQTLMHRTVLIEVASPLFYDKRPSVVHRTCAWMLFNTFITTRIAMHMRAYTLEPLVAPSSEWTCGYPELIRHQMADVHGDNHDIREARCMQAFYARSPSKWVPFTQYFTGFSFKEESKTPKKTRKSA